MSSSSKPVSNLARAIAMWLWLKKVPPDTASKAERVLQEWVSDQIEEWVKKNHPDRFRIKCEPKTGGVEPIRAFETSFWPDISIESPDKDLLVAVEVKYLTPGSVPSQVSQALGQALVYRQIYQQSLVVLVPRLKLDTPPPPFFENVAEHQIELTLLQVAGQSNV